MKPLLSISVGGYKRGRVDETDKDRERERERERES